METYYEQMERIIKLMKEEKYSVEIHPEIADFLGDPSATGVVFRNGQFQTNNGLPIDSEVWHTFDPMIMAGASGGEALPSKERLDSVLSDYGISGKDYDSNGYSINLRKRASKNDIREIEKRLPNYSIKNAPSLGYKAAAGGALALFGLAMASGCLADDKKTDSDKDGLSNWDEKNTYKTDPKNPDTDGDNLWDGVEVNQYKTSPLKADTDGDGLRDNLEINQYKTNPLKADTDGDNFTDGFEVNVAKLDPNIKNDRYVIISSRNYDHEKSSSGKNFAAAVQVPDLYDFLLEEGKIPKENIIYLQKPSYTEFKNAIDEVARKADSNDIVYIELHGETRTLVNQFGIQMSHDYIFSDKYVSPSQIGSLLDKIHAKSTTVSVELCYAGYFLDEMKDPGRIVITGSDKTQVSPNADVGMYFFEAMGHDVGTNYYDHYTLNENPDKDGNGYVSVKEACEIVQKKMAKVKISNNGLRPNNALFSDPSGIAGSTYLVEYKLPSGYKV